MKISLRKSTAVLLCITLICTMMGAFALDETETETEMITFEQLITDGGAKGAKVSKFEWSQWANNYYETEKEGKKAAYTFANFNANSAGRANPGDKAKVTFSSPIELTGTEYLEFWIFSDEFAPTGVILDYGAWTTVNATITADEWCFVKVPLNKGELKNIFVDYVSVKAANPDDNTLFRIYVSDMRITRPLERAAAECVYARVNNEGKLTVKLVFSKALSEESVTKNAFTVEGLTCTDAVYSNDEKSVELTFDGQLEFPKEYTLAIADTVRDSEKYSVSTAPVIFRTNNFQSELAAKSVTADKSAAAADGVVKISADVSTIYRKNSEVLKFIAVAAIVKDNNVLAIGESAEFTAADRGGSTTVSQFYVTDESLKLLDGTEEIQLFLVSTEDRLMPLAEVKSIK